MKTQKDQVKKLSSDVHATDGTVVGQIDMPETYFHAKVNPALMAQAVRVFLANQREGSASTKTRGKVEGSTRKIFKQKGTGNARHGSRRAPIFVGGGIVFGPQPRSYTPSLPKKMKKKAVQSALSYQFEQNAVKVISDIESLGEKTKQVLEMCTKLQIQKKTLVLVTKEQMQHKKMFANISTMTLMPVSDVYTYVVLNNQNILLTKQAIEALTTL